MIKTTPEGWIKIKLGDIGKFSTSSVDKKSVEGEKEVCLLNYMDVYNHSTLTEDYPFKKVTAPRKQVLSSSVHRGDVFFTPSSETPDDIGHSAVFIGDLENIVHSYHTIRFRCASNEYLDDHFKSYAFKGADTYEYFRKRATGSTRFTLSLPVFHELELTVPPLAEQKKITSILASVDELIENTHKQIDKLQDLKKATMNELLTKGIGNKEFKDSEFGQIPENWEINELNDCLEIMTDYVANGSFQSLRENVNVKDKVDHALYVRLFDIRKGIIHQSQKYVDKNSYNFLKKSSLYGDEILIANIGANVGEVNLMPKLNKPATLAPNMILLRVSKNYHYKFLYYFLSSDLGQKIIHLSVAGSGQEKLNKTDLKKINVVLPPLDEQIKISEIILKIEQRILMINKKLNKHILIKNSLMQDLLTGKVRIKVN